MYHGFQRAHIATLSQRWPRAPFGVTSLRKVIIWERLPGCGRLRQLRSDPNASVSAENHMRERLRGLTP